MEWENGRPRLTENDGHASVYDLVCVSAGVNSNFIKLLKDSPSGIEPPKTTRTYICEFKVGRDGVKEIMGNEVLAQVPDEDCDEQPKLQLRTPSLNETQEQAAKMFLNSTSKRLHLVQG